MLQSPKKKHKQSINSSLAFAKSTSFLFLQSLKVFNSLANSPISTKILSFNLSALTKEFQSKSIVLC